MFKQDICGLLFINMNIFNDVNRGKNFNLKESFLLAATRKNETKLREKTWKKKMTAMNVTSVNMRYQI